MKYRLTVLCDQRRCDSTESRNYHNREFVGSGVLENCKYEIDSNGIPLLTGKVNINKGSEFSQLREEAAMIITNLRLKPKNI